MAGIVAMDNWVQARITESLAALNSSGLPLVLRLYQNNVALDPSFTSSGAFTECTFDTYTTFALSSGPNNFGSPFRVVYGEWETDSPTFTYLGPTVTGNTIYGWYITDSGPSSCYLAYSFPVPIPFNVGAPDLVLLIKYQEWARSLLP